MGEDINNRVRFADLVSFIAKVYPQGYTKTNVIDKVCRADSVLKSNEPNHKREFAKVPGIAKCFFVFHPK